MWLAGCSGSESWEASKSPDPDRSVQVQIEEKLRNLLTSNRRLPTSKWNNKKLSVLEKDYNRTNVFLGKTKVLLECFECMIRHIFIFFKYRLRLNLLELC